jgi:hypothetical protein
MAERTALRTGGGRLAFFERKGKVETLADEVAEVFVGTRDGSEAGDAARVDGGKHAVDAQAETGLTRRERFPRGEAGTGDRVGGVAGEDHGDGERGAPPRGGAPAGEGGEERGEQGAGEQPRNRGEGGDFAGGEASQQGEDEPEQGRAVSEAATGHGGGVTANRR